MSPIVALFIVFGSLSLIVAGDTAGKILATHGVSPFFIAWSRFALAALLLLPILRLKSADFGNLLNWRILLRAFLIVAAISSILTALKTEPIANVFGAFFIGPIIAYFLAVFFLKEPLLPSRLIATFIGFIGVLLVVKPGFGFSTGLYFALQAGSFYGGYLVATRWLAPDYPAPHLLFSQLAFGGTILAPLALNIPPTIPDIVLESQMIVWIFVSALGSACGNFFLVVVSRHIAATLMAPMVYTQLIAATIAGYIAFDTIPDTISLIGLGLIMASGFSSLLFRYHR